VICPVCSQPTRVLQTQATERRRECTRCGHRFVTAEILKDALKRYERIVEDGIALADRIREAV